MRDAEHHERQRRFYAAGCHDHLRPGDDDLYARKLVGRVNRSVGLSADHSVLEVGAGFGRFTFELLAGCRSVVAVDFSPRALEALSDERRARGISEDRCRVLEADVTKISELDLPTRFDLVVGWFFLHHLPDFGDTIARLAPLVEPGGAMAFVEPNRRNPLFAAQLTFCRDMSWREEKGLYRVSARGVERAFRDAGLEPRQRQCFGFFPPAIVNQSARARRLEERLEGWRPLRGWLPFLLLWARRPSARESPVAHP